MSWLQAGALQHELVRACTASGAPGVSLRSESGGRYNPVTELLREFSAVAAEALSAQIQTSSWSSPSGPGLPAPPSPFPVGLPLPTLSAPEQSLRARKIAEAVGWTGPSRAVLFVGVFHGMTSALTKARPISIRPELRAAVGAQIPSVYQFQPRPLPISVLRGRLEGRWSQNSFLSQGDPRPRRRTARGMVEVLAEVWSSLAPICATTGPIPGGTPSPSLPAAVL